MRPRAESLARLETMHLRRARSGRVNGMVQHLAQRVSFEGAAGEGDAGADDASSRSRIIRARDIFAMFRTADAGIAVADARGGGARG
jgi:hypothetical protein